MPESEILRFFLSISYRIGVSHEYCVLAVFAISIPQFEYLI